MVHRITTVPTPNPVTVVVVLFGLVMVPVPLTMLQVPVAAPTGAFPVTVTTGLVEHTLWSGPAAAACAFWSKMVTATWSVVGAPHGPLFTVHWNTFVPIPRLVMVVVGEPGLVMVPLPLTNVQVPVAGNVTALPAMVAVVNGVQALWSGPAFATGWFGSKRVMVT